MNEETLYDLDEIARDESETDAMVNDPKLLQKAFIWMVVLFCILWVFFYVLLAYPLYFLGVCASLLIGYCVYSRIKN